jgi:hypothetical protein
VIAQQREHTRRGYALRLAWLLVGLAGCSPSQNPYVVKLTKSEENLKFVAMAFTDATDQDGKPPQNADELKPHLKGFGNPDELLKSPNDNLPYVIIWGARPTGGPTEYKGMFPILAYEAKGSGGRRAVTDIRGRPMTVSNDDFTKLKFIGRHKPVDN